MELLEYFWVMFLEESPVGADGGIFGTISLRNMEFLEKLSDFVYEVPGGVIKKEFLED